ncbi:MAG: ribosome maturation factor RimP [Deltaproteobacteria bacterium]
MAHHDTLLKIKAAVGPHLEQAGYVLVDLRLYRNQGGEQVLEVLADRPEGGITLGECAALSREIGVILERDGVATGRYLLDVSSPGMDRPLAGQADFRRVRGRRIRVFLSAAVAEKIEHCGVLEEAGPEAIRLALEDRTIDITYDKINKAKQVV